MRRWETYSTSWQVLELCDSSHGEGAEDNNGRLHLDERFFFVIVLRWRIARGLD
jgi:hypothetical protein